jgi:hypothetical protein
LGALVDNGGPTATHALLPGSPAINAGDNSTCAAAPVSSVDQRGVSRPQGAMCDSGAYEYQTPTAVTLAGLEAASSSSALAVPVYLLAMIWLAALLLIVSSKAPERLARPG